MTQKNSVLVRYPIHNSTSSVRVFIRVNAVYIFSSISLRCFLILSYDLLIDLLFPSGPPPQQRLVAFIVFAYVPHAQPISSLLDYLSNICWEKSRSSMSTLVSSEMWLSSLVEPVPTSITSLGPPPSGYMQQEISLESRYMSARPHMVKAPPWPHYSALGRSWGASI